MSNSITLTLTDNSKPLGSLNEVFANDNEQLGLIKMSQYLNSMACGNVSASLTSKVNTGNAVQASQTLTIATAAATNTAVVNGVTITAADGREKTTLTARADSSGDLNDTYFVFYSALNAKKYYVWYNINSAGTDPAVASATAIPVAGATGATASTLGGATRTAITSIAGADVTVSGSTTGIIIQNKLPGVTTATVDTGTTGFTIVRTITGAAITSSQFQIDASDTTSAVNLAATLNATAALTPFVSAASALGVVTVTAVAYGISGNTITSAATGNITAAGARLAGGVADSSAITYQIA